MDSTVLLVCFIEDTDQAKEPKKLALTGVPRLVINFKPLSKALRWIRYHISNMKDLL